MDLAMLAPYLGVITNAQAIPATPIPTPGTLALPNGSISPDSDILKAALTVLAALVGALIGGVIAPLINRATSLQAAKQTSRDSAFSHATRPPALGVRLVCSHSSNSLNAGLASTSTG